MDSETKFYVVLGILICTAITIGWLAINNFQAPVTITQPFRQPFR